jgi:ABC-type branched-subunit amino acid transport system ATPase component
MTKSESPTAQKAGAAGNEGNYAGIIGANGSGRRTMWAGGQQRFTGAIHGGSNETADALPERGYTIHVGSLPELRGLL